MRRLVFVILVLPLLFGLVFVQKGNIPAVKASPPIHQGDLILTNNDEFVIQNERYDINGSIIVEENATLILKNAVVNFTQTENFQYEIRFRKSANGNPRLQVENANITASNYLLWISFLGNSSATIYSLNTSSKVVLGASFSSFVSMSDSTMEGALYAYSSSTVDVSWSTISLMWGLSSSTVTVSNCTISEFIARDSSHVNISNSTIRHLDVGSDSVDCRIFGLEPGFFNSWNYLLDCSVVVASGGWAPEVRLKDSQIEDWDFRFLGSSNATITNSTIYILVTTDSSVATASNSIIDLPVTYYNSVVWLVNSTYSSYTIDQDGKVYVCWYLDVHVEDSIGQDVPYADVVATYPDATPAESKLTDAQGWARLTLTEKMMNKTGEYPVGNYTVDATYESYSDDITVNMTGNKQIILTLEPFVIPEFPSSLVLPLLIFSTLLVAILSKAKRRNNRA